MDLEVNKKYRCIISRAFIYVLVNSICICYLVCSRSLAEDIAANKLTIKDAEVSLSNGIYGLIRPDTSKVIATVELW